MSLNRFVFVSCLMLLLASGLSFFVVWSEGQRNSTGTLIGALAVFWAVLISIGILLLQIKRRMSAAILAFMKQIDALGNGRFVQLRQSEVADLIPLSKSLNLLVARIELLLASKEHQTEDLQTQLDHDPLTHVASRTYFMERLEQALELSRAAGDEGLLIIIRVNDLLNMNRRIGRERTDDCLLAISTALRTKLHRFESTNHVLGRLNGSDFGVLLPSLAESERVVLLEDLHNALQKIYLDQLSDRPEVAWIGATAFRSLEQISTVLTRVDEMLMKCEVDRLHYCFSPAEQQFVRYTLSQWRTLIEHALDTHALLLEFFPVVEVATQTLLHMEGMLRVKDPDGLWLSASVVVPPAVRCARIHQLDLQMLELAVFHIKTFDFTVAVNLSANSLEHPYFLSKFQELLTDLGTEAGRLAVEVNENAIVDFPFETRRLSQMLRASGAKFGIERFGRDLMPMLPLLELDLSYIKLDTRLTDRIFNDAKKQAYLKLLASLAAEQHLNLIADHVIQEDDIRCLMALGIGGFSGPWMTQNYLRE